MKKTPLRDRLRLALHVLRGKPLCYRMNFRGEGPTVMPYDDTTIVFECSFTGGAYYDQDTMRNVVAKYVPEAKLDSRCPGCHANGQKVDIFHSDWIHDLEGFRNFDQPFPFTKDEQKMRARLLKEPDIKIASKPKFDHGELD